MQSTRTNRYVPLCLASCNFFPGCFKSSYLNPHRQSPLTQEPDIQSALGKEQEHADFYQNYFPGPKIVQVYSATLGRHKDGCMKNKWLVGGKEVIRRHPT